MEIPREDLERLMAIEQTREMAQKEFQKNPTDPDVLVKLGRSLVELSQFANGPDCTAMLDDAVKRLQEAVRAAPSKADAHWWLGNAHTTLGFQTTEGERAQGCFGKAAECFRNALKEDPENEAYKKSLEVSLKGPELHQELQKQMALQQAVAAAAQQPPGATQSNASAAAAAKKKKNYDFYYDVGGWVILSVGVIAWLSLLSARTAQQSASA